MLIALALAISAALAQAPPPQPPPASPASPQATAPQPGAPPELPVLDAHLGACSADFTIKDADGKPLYLALVHVKVRYGALGVKRMDLEVGTNSEGKARIKGLPDKARPMTYDITKDDKKTTVDQDVEKSCNAKLEATVK
jgi:hypothetical protein